jgi:hypothetical protein
MTTEMYTTILWDGDVEVGRVTGLATLHAAQQVGQRHVLSASDGDCDEGPDAGPFFTIIEEN